MKIVFICGSLEPGEDGVGDYTRRLAGELIRQGLQIQIISLFDKHTKEPLEEMQDDLKIKINCLRIPFDLSKHQRFYLAKAFIDCHDPEWLSLQFVPYSFQKKGIPTNLLNLKMVGLRRKWHIMFHELWLGMDKESRLKFKALGVVQKKIINNIYKNINPEVVSTHSQIYQQQLASLGIDSFLLPLFGNIPNNNINIITDKEQISFVLFGGIHSGANVRDFFIWLKIIQKSFKVELNFIGVNGNELKEWISNAENFDINYKIHGRQSVEFISVVLKQSNVGITTTPFLLSEKSGAIAAMHEFALPVLCVARKWIPSNINIDSINIHGVTPWHIDLNIEQILGPEVNSTSPRETAQKLVNQFK